MLALSSGIKITDTVEVMNVAFKRNYYLGHLRVRGLLNVW
jgi:hypothetical protein